MSAAAVEATRASCLYEGSVRHRRHGALRDELHHRLCMAYLDLDELPELFDPHPLWSARRPALAWFRRADYLGDPADSLREAVAALVGERTGLALDGPVRLLTHLRFLGHCFNPVSFYYCFDAHGERVRAVVAEVTNTPWGERHAYVLEAEDAQDGRVIHGEFQKELHVSPLMGMDHTYDWRLTVPGERLSVHIDSLRRGGSPAHGCGAGHGGGAGPGAEGETAPEPLFDATLSLARREIDARSLRRVLLRYPLPTVRLTAHIYAHALLLRLRGASWHPHPARGGGGEEVIPA